MTARKGKGFHPIVASEGEEDGRPEDDVPEVGVGNELGRRETGRRSKVAGEGGRQRQQHGARNPRTHGAEVIQPLPELQTEDIQDGDQGRPAQR